MSIALECRRAISHGARPISSAAPALLAALHCRSRNLPPGATSNPRRSAAWLTRSGVSSPNAVAGCCCRRERWRSRGAWPDWQGAARCSWAGSGWRRVWPIDCPPADYQLAAQLERCPRHCCSRSAGHTGSTVSALSLAQSSRRPRPRLMPPAGVDQRYVAAATQRRHLGARSDQHAGQRSGAGELEQEAARLGAAARRRAAGRAAAPTWRAGFR